MRERLTPPEGRACLTAGVDSGCESETDPTRRTCMLGRWCGQRMNRAWTPCSVSWSVAELALLGRYHRLAVCAHGQREEKD